MPEEGGGHGDGDGWSAGGAAAGAGVEEEVGAAWVEAGGEEWDGVVAVSGRCWRGMAWRWK